jgi:hypothetical protein
MLRKVSITGLIIFVSQVRGGRTVIVQRHTLSLWWFSL